MHLLSIHVVYGVIFNLAARSMEAATIQHLPDVSKLPPLGKFMRLCMSVNSGMRCV